VQTVLLHFLQTAMPVAHGLQQLLLWQPSTLLQVR
jgi:hypothetical protein